MSAQKPAEQYKCARYNSNICASGEHGAEGFRMPTPHRDHWLRSQRGVQRDASVWRRPASAGEDGPDAIKFYYTRLTKYISAHVDWLHPMHTHWPGSDGYFIFFGKRKDARTASDGTFFVLVLRRGVQTGWADSGYAEYNRNRFPRQNNSGGGGEEVALGWRAHF